MGPSIFAAGLASGRREARGSSPSRQASRPLRLPQARLDQVLDRFREVEARMGAATDGAEIVRLAKEHAELKPVADAVERPGNAPAPSAPELEEMAAGGDAEMAAMARDELRGAERARCRRWSARWPCCWRPRTRTRTPRPSWKCAPAPAATRRRCSPATCSACTSATPPTRGWRVEVDSVSEGEAGGYKEIIASVTGDGVFGRLKFESGVHRVQRVPATEAQGRIHTSAATVAVLPEAEDVEIEINDARHPHRHLPLVRRRRPARQQDRLGRAHHPPAHRHRGDLVGEVAAPEPRARR